QARQEQNAQHARGQHDSHTTAETGPRFLEAAIEVIVDGQVQIPGADLQLVQRRHHPGVLQQWHGAAVEEYLRLLMRLDGRSIQLVKIVVQSLEDFQLQV